MSRKFSKYGVLCSQITNVVIPLIVNISSTTWDSCLKWKRNDISDIHNQEDNSGEK